MALTWPPASIRHAPLVSELPICPCTFYPALPTYFNSCQKCIDDRNSFNGAECGVVYYAAFKAINRQSLNTLLYAWDGILSDFSVTEFDKVVGPILSPF